MSLIADLQVRIDAGALKDDFLNNSIAVGLQDLGQVQVPAPADHLEQALTLSGSVDASGIGSSVTRVAGEITPLLGTLPVASNVLTPITASLELVEALTEADLDRAFSDLTERLSQELGGGREGGFPATLIALAQAFEGSPQGPMLSRLLAVLARATSLDLPVSSTTVSGTAAAIAGAARTLGGLMSVESTLDETERLARVMSEQLSPQTLEQRTQAVLASLRGEGTSLAQFLAGIDVTSPSQVQAAQVAIQGVSLRLQSLIDYAREGMGLGEATLVYLDMSRVQADLSGAVGMLDEADLQPLERLMQSAADRLVPLLSIDLSGAPSLTLDELVGQLEARINEMAAGLETIDIGGLAGDLNAQVRRVTAAPRALAESIDQVNAAVIGALDAVRDAVAPLPIETVATTIRQVLQPLTEALEFIESLVGTIKDALQTAVNAALTPLQAVDQATDKFKKDVEDLFLDAKKFIDDLNLDEKIGQVAQNIQEFTDLIAKAQMQPYFDTATSAIDAATGVVEKVPFSLLPDSMESEVVAAIRPIKQTDAGAVSDEIKNLLQIDPGGKFQLREEIEKAIEGVQQKYDELIAEVKKLDPHKVADDIDVEFQKLADSIRDLAPQVELKPVQDAIGQLRGALTSVDLDQALDPLREGFDQVLAKVDEYSPAALVDPLVTRVDEARNKLLEQTRMKEWEEHLNLIHQRAVELTELLDPQKLEGQIREALEEAKEFVEAAPQFEYASSLGSLISAMMAGSGLRANPLSFPTVIDWLRNGGGTAAVSGRIQRTLTYVTTTRTAVESFDPAALSLQLSPLAPALRSAVEGLPAGEARDSLLAAAGRLDRSADLASLGGNRTRYLASLETSRASFDTLNRMGFPQVDEASGNLAATIAPLNPLGRVLQDAIGLTGLGGPGLSVNEAIQRVFAAIPPERLAALTAPFYVTIRDRFRELLDAVIVPLRDGVQDLIAAVEAIDLGPLRDSIQGIHSDTRRQIASLHPDEILGDALRAFEDAQTQLEQFDPLADILDSLRQLNETAAKLLTKLSAQELLKTPLGIYDDLRGTVAALDPRTLLTPVFDQLDSIAEQVDTGLEATVTSFEGLQDALPSQVGSTSVSASASVAVG